MNALFIYIIDDDDENNKPVVHSMVDGAPTSAGIPNKFDSHLAAAAPRR